MVMIKINKKLFNFIFIINTYIKTFMFKRKKPQVLIKVIKNKKSEIALKTITFIILTSSF